MALSPGGMLSHYRLVEKIGEGGRACRRISAGLALRCLLALLLLAGFAGTVGGQEIPWETLLYSSSEFRDIDGDGDRFPDTGETGRVSITLRNTGPTLTGATFILTPSDPDIDCIVEGIVDVGTVSGGQLITVGSLDLALPGFTFKASDTLETPSPSEIATIELCVRVTANEHG